MKIVKKHTASFDVDAQKGFTPICPDELPVEGGDHIFASLNEQAHFARYRVGSKDAHPNGALWEATKENPQFSVVGSKNVDIRWAKHCVVGTTGGELLDELPAVYDYDYFVWKGIETYLHPYGACYHDLGDSLSTGVIEYLESKDIDTVIVGGLATDYCVKTTAMQLKDADFNVIVNLDACSGITKETTDSAIEEMKNNNIVVIDNLDDIVVVK